MKDTMTVYGVSSHKGDFFDKEKGKNVTFDFMKFNVLSEQKSSADFPKAGLGMTAIRGDSSLYVLFEGQQDYPVEVELDLFVTQKAGEPTIEARNAKILSTVALKKSA